MISLVDKRSLFVHFFPSLLHTQSQNYFLFLLGNIGSLFLVPFEMSLFSWIGRRQWSTHTYTRGLKGKPSKPHCWFCSTQKSEWAPQSFAGLSKTGSKMVACLCTETGAKMALHLQLPDVIGSWGSPQPIGVKYWGVLSKTFVFDCLCLDILV